MHAKPTNPLPSVYIENQLFELESFVSIAKHVEIHRLEVKKFLSLDHFLSF